MNSGLTGGERFLDDELILEITVAHTGRPSYLSNVCIQVQCEGDDGPGRTGALGGTGCEV